MRQKPTPPRNPRRRTPRNHRHLHARLLRTLLETSPHRRAATQQTTPRMPRMRAETTPQQNPRVQTSRHRASRSTRILQPLPQEKENKMSTITTVAPEVVRDRWGRPLITPPDGGKPV